MQQTLKTLSKEIQKSYNEYTRFLVEGDFVLAAKAAANYNYFLKLAGGPEANPSEAYLSMGEVA